MLPSGLITFSGTAPISLVPAGGSGGTVTTKLTLTFAGTT
jgi:hypothetical protein